MSRSFAQWCIFGLLCGIGICGINGLNPLFATDAEPKISQWDAAFSDRTQLPAQAKTRVWWWWLNSNVDEAAITRDLEAMAAKGIGGLNLIDAGGAARPHWSEEVPIGPRFASPEWTKLFVHALNEARRLNIEVGLNIQSGWNLGDPEVTPEQACKYITTSETNVVGKDGKTQTIELPQPKINENFYRDIAVFAIPCPPERDRILVQCVSSSFQKGMNATNVLDQNHDTFWVSGGSTEGLGPTAGKPEFLDFTFSDPTEIQTIAITPRTGYGPKTCQLLVETNDANNDTNSASTAEPKKLSYWKNVASFSMKNDQTYTIEQNIIGQKIRLLIESAYDPRFPEKPRNAQICEVQFTGPRFAEPRREIRDLGDKMSVRELPWSSPKSEHLLTDVQEITGEEDCTIDQLINLTSFCKNGNVTWNVPDGKWNIVRIGYTVAPGAKVSTCTPGSGGLCIDYLDPREMRHYWNRVVEPLCKAAGDHVGTTWMYCHTDSWELGGINWTENFTSEFFNRRGYDITPWLPVLAGKIIESRDASNRFLNDFRRTIADCVVNNHYDVMNELAAQHGLQIHPESGGPHGAPLDGLQAIGHSAIPMMEFWAKSKTHRVRVEDRHFCKQGSSAANIYNRRLVQAEGFTTVGPHWEETLWDNLRPTFDYAATEGLNRLVWHTFTCSPESAGLPGQVYFAGTHGECQTTWWSYAQSFFDYLNRSQFLLQQGVASADVLYYSGDWIPNFVRGKKDDPAGVLPGYDWDVTNEEALVLYADVNENGKIVFPSGAEYHLLVLPPQPCISLATLRKIEELVRKGATVVGERPTRTTGLVAKNGQGTIDDTLVTEITERLWGNASSQQSPDHCFGYGRVVQGRTARETLIDMNVKPAFDVVYKNADQPDFTIPKVPENACEDGKIRHIGDPIAWIERTCTDGTRFYLISNQSEERVELTVLLRVPQNIPAELWNPVTGAIHRVTTRTDFSPNDPQISPIPLRLEPFQCVYVVFRSERPANEPPIQASWCEPNDLEPITLGEITGPWTVRFASPRDLKPTFETTFDSLTDWSLSSDDRIRYFSGTATYCLTFDGRTATETLDAAKAEPTTKRNRIGLNLGMLREIGAVRLNGQNIGIVWEYPFRIDITDAVRPDENTLEIDVTNFWPNALIGESKRPPEQRVYRTNVIKFNDDSLLKNSGLLGPVTLEAF